MQSLRNENTVPKVKKNLIKANIEAIAKKSRDLSIIRDPPRNNLNGSGYYSNKTSSKKKTNSSVVNSLKKE